MVDSSFGVTITGLKLISCTGAGVEIVNQSGQTRIERNTVVGNGGPAQIVIATTAVDADVVGNATAFSILDLGTGTEQQDNQ